MGRGMQIAVLGAVVVGSVGGGLTALLTAPPPAAQPATAIAAPAAPRQATPAAPADAQTAPPLPPDPHLVIATSMTTVLTRFAAWAHDHVDEPCPDVASLGLVALDPWGHAIEITCTDQPADQMIGAISAGPDGIAGTGDDVESWSLGREVTELVRGTRWKSTQSAATRTRPVTRRHNAPPAATRTPPGPIDAGGDDIPARR